MHSIKLAVHPPAPAAAHEGRGRDGESRSGWRCAAVTALVRIGSAACRVQHVHLARQGGRVLRVCQDSPQLRWQKRRFRISSENRFAGPDPGGERRAHRLQHQVQGGGGRARHMDGEVRGDGARAREDEGGAREYHRRPRGTCA